jgi:hypothetical protein
LEKRGVLQNKFRQKFRRRKPWKVDWSSAPPTAGAATPPEAKEAD